VSKTLKFGIFLLALICLGLFVITIVTDPLEDRVSGLAAVDEKPSRSMEGDPDLIAAVKSALDKAGGRWAAFNYDIDHIQIQDDGRMAIVWLVAIDPETEVWIDREPELALAKLDETGQWQVLLEDNEIFNQNFKSFQYADKSIQGDLVAEDQAMPKSGTVFGGYYLPWVANLEKRLTWSVGHTSCYPTYYCTHAFDFADGTMFPLVAAKGGTVYHWKDTCANGDSSCTNSITLQDRSTTPWTYQIYLHIAQNSIPSGLKKVGTAVMRGQYIATVDDTGYSTGHHVHFMVVTENTRYLSYKGYVWGVAEDITFRDVDINWDAATQGGRPRLAYEAASYGGVGRTYYTSGNQPANPPTGGLTTPVTKTYVTNPLMAVTGWGQDDIMVTKYEILANYANAWVTIKEVPTTKTSFSSSVNLCETTVPDGPFQLALRVWDYEGNPSGIVSARKLIKGVDCGPAGTDPTVTLTLTDGILPLPQTGFVSADVTKGSTGKEIMSVEFWFHGQNWGKDKWVNLGKDTNGANGWQAFINTTAMPEGTNYILLAVATDSAGNQDADVNFNAIVDHTVPQVTVDPIKSPFMGNVVTFTWTAQDALTGIAYYDLGVYMDSGPYQSLGTHIAGTTTTYQIPVSREQILIFEVRAYDHSGNLAKGRISVYTDGYVFPYGYIMPVFFNGSK